MRWLIAGLTACSSGEPAPPPAASSAVVSAASAASAAPEREYGPHWERAASSREPLDVAEVGRREGGAGLAAALEHPRYAPIARAALPAVPDAMLAAATLARRARAHGPEAQEDVDALIAVLRAPVVIGERLDPEGEAAAYDDLLALAGDASQERALRARAVTALRLLAARGVGDAARIPGELDD